MRHYRAASLALILLLALAGCGGQATEAAPTSGLSPREAEMVDWYAAHNDDLADLLEAEAEAMADFSGVDALSLDMVAVIDDYEDLVGEWEDALGGQLMGDDLDELEDRWTQVLGTVGDVAGVLIDLSAASEADTEAAGESLAQAMYHEMPLIVDETERLAQ